MLDIKKKRLRIGRLSFCNVMPFFWRSLEETNWYSYVDGVPKELNRGLRSGVIDFAPSSSIEYAKNFRELLLHPSLCIAGTERVLSVALFSNYPFHGLHTKKVGLSGASDTSVALFHILCAMKHKVVPLCEIKESNQCYDAELVIGDAALSMQLSNPYTYVFDLAQEWFSWTGLPFVFALWIAQKKSMGDTDLAQLLSLYIQEIEVNLSLFSKNRDEAIALWKERFSIDLPTDYLKYYFSCMGYQLTEKHRESLALFFDYCFELGILSEKSPLEYLPIGSSL